MRMLWILAFSVMVGCAVHDRVHRGVFDVVPVSGRLRGGDLTLSWTPATPLTQQMSLGAHVANPGCPSCNRTDLGPAFVPHAG